MVELSIQDCKNLKAGNKVAKIITAIGFILMGLAACL